MTILGLFKVGKPYDHRLIKNTITSLYIFRAFPSAKSYLLKNISVIKTTGVEECGIEKPSTVGKKGS